MSTFNIRYGGQIESIPEGFNFNANYGTDKLHIKVNSTSTMKFGLTTNTNAQEYCHFSVRIGGQTAYIGRVYSTSYSDAVYSYSSSLPPYTPSSGYSTTSSKSTYSNSIVTSSSTDSLRWAGVYSSSESVSTKTTSQQTQSYTRNAGSGDGTAAANPTIRTVTNNTGSSVTTRTASAEVASLTWYSFSANPVRQMTRRETYTLNRSFPAVGANKTLTIYRTRNYLQSVFDQYINVRGSNYQKVYNTWIQCTYLYTYTLQDWSDWVNSTKSSTRYIKSSSASNSTGATTTTPYKETQSVMVNWANTNIVAYDYKAVHATRTLVSTMRYTTTQNGYVSTVSSTTYVTSQSRGPYITTGRVVSAQPIQTLYDYSTRWSYWWTSCSKYTNTTYFTGTTFYSTITYRSETNSYTCHNMNI